MQPPATRENARRGGVAGLAAYLIRGLAPVFFRRIGACRLASADFCDIQIRPVRLAAETQPTLAAALAEDLAPHAASCGDEMTRTVLVATARPV